MNKTITPRIITLILLFSCMMVIAFSNNSDETTEPIYLEGDYLDGGIRSGGDIICAEIQGNILISHFYMDIGFIHIKVNNHAYETVYETIINTSEQGLLLIPLTGLPPGEYTIQYHKEGNYLYGDFEI